MPQGQVVVRADDPRCAALEAEGWAVVARSWAAQLTASEIDRSRLRALVERGRNSGELREISNEDVHAILALDAATLADYPGGIATRHAALTEQRARVNAARRGFGLFDSAGRALAVTYVEVDGRQAETDFTVVDREHRGLGIGAAVKAASVLALIDVEVEIFRTGGSADNAASLATNRSVGYVIDEHWVTLTL